METKINLIEILKDKPQGTKLYSPICGECKLSYIESEKSEPQIGIESDAFGAFYFWDDGKAYVEGECLLFPSDKMRDWAKFSWNKGDVLKNTAYEERVIFDGFLNDDYTYFKGKHPLDCSDKLNITYHEECNCFTGNYRLESTDAAQTYINTIEERLGGKLNRETLEIEKSEFKDGDIVALVVRKCTHIAIFQSRQEAYIGFHAVLCQNDELLLEEPFREDVGDIELRLATDSEKQQLFDALAKEGKRWDSEKKQIVDLKPKCEFKPFDKVLCRNSKDDTWEADFFARLTRKEIDYTQSGKYLCVGDLWMYCIPYNEETAHLLGTTDEWKGGEQ